ncbi:MULTISPECIES: sensor histidine kinase [Antarcticibacterium]|nr:MULTISPECIES: ATP-binding protein [Antarcticibacterium]
MKITKINELKSVYDIAMKLVTGETAGKLDEAYLNRVFAPSFNAYGPDEAAICSNLQEFRDRMAKLRTILDFSSLLKEPSAVERSYSPGKIAAVYIDKFRQQIKDAPLLRVSTFLFKTDDGWQVTHMHLSFPSSFSKPTVSKPLEDEAQSNQNYKIQLEERTRALNDSLEVLKATQAQLLRQEKLASLGQLTAGIAHEIKNPLNFINNFSELSLEFLDEIKEQLEKLDPNEATEEINFLLEDVKANLAKIYQHGTRADGIVKSMLLHSRGGNGKMEDVDLNTLIREYVNLAFHGMRANKNPINVDIQLDTDPGLGLVKMNAENFSRVILNLCKNAFDAMREKLEQKDTKDYTPKLIVRTKHLQDKVIVEVEDNGPGVPEGIKEKLITPFFTTKKGSEGTGLGLSISMDIIQSHGGVMDITTKEKEFTCFTIKLNKEGPGPDKK